MLDGIAVGVEQCGVKITQRAVTGLTVVRQANVAAAQVHTRVVAGENDEGIFPAVTVMGLTAVREIKEHRVVEHRTVTLRHTLQAVDNAINQLHVMRTSEFTDRFCR